MNDTQPTKGQWGGARPGSGRPKKHSDDTPVRTLWLRATDDEWALPSDSRDKFLLLSSLLAQEEDTTDQ